MNDIKSFRDLLVWQKSMDLTPKIYQLTKTFPKDETYGLMSQMRRCSVSISSNIAEGGSRRSNGEFIRYVNIASGSAAELETQLLTAQRLNYISEGQLEPLISQLHEISKMLYGLYYSLEQKKAA